jgi:N-methylhydantoinase A
MAADHEFGAWLQALYGPVENRAKSEMSAEGYVRESLTCHYSLDCRYLGQSHELNIPYSLGEDAQTVVAAFHAAHERRYGYSRPEATVELVTPRLAVVAPITLPDLPRLSGGTNADDIALIGEDLVWFGNDFMPAKLYERSRLEPGNRFHGPAVVYQYDTTTLLPSGWQAVVDWCENLILTISQVDYPL